MSKHAWRKVARWRALLGGVSLLAMIPLAAPVWASTISVDGDVAEWPALVGTDNLGRVVRAPDGSGVFVWRDAPGDHVTDLAGSESADLQSVRITGDGTSLYIAATLSGDPTAVGAACLLTLAIDLDGIDSSGETDLPNTATAVAPSAAWEFLVTTRIGSGQSALVLTDPAGNSASAGLSAWSFEANEGRIEASIPWSALGLAGPPSERVRLSLATFLSDGTDTVLDVPMRSDAIDVLTDYGMASATGGSATSSEVSDGIINDSLDLYFNDKGEVVAPISIVAFGAGDLQFVALQNVSSTNVDLLAYGFGDEPIPGGSDGTFEQPTVLVLAPDTNAYLASDAELFSARFGFSATAELATLDAHDLWSDGTFDLDAGGDELIVLDPTFTIVDSIAWGSGAVDGVEALGVIEAMTVRRRDPGVDTDSSADFELGDVCLVAAESAPCDDGDACTVGDACMSDRACSGSALDCSALDDQCASGVCDEDRGCIASPATRGTPCDDDDPCTSGDSCQLGVCEAGADYVCGADMMSGDMSGDVVAMDVASDVTADIRTMEREVVLPWRDAGLASGGPDCSCRSVVESDDRERSMLWLGLFVLGFVLTIRSRR